MVFGDSDGDVEMLHDFADTALAVIINRCLPGPIGALSRRAVHEQAGPVPGSCYRDAMKTPANGYSDSATIRYGSTTPRLLA
ncbi:hypothetical protein RAA17_21755 [Komagataeibacter rhaeticus]|nr:hypothetical protein [Komagataeibacter rhaeticus]